MTNQEKLQNLIATGVKDNIELAFGIATSNGIEINVEPYKKVLMWLNTYHAIYCDVSELNPKEIIYSALDCIEIGVDGEDIQSPLPSEISILVNIKSF